MTPEEFDAFCLSLPATSVVVQWGDSQVFKVGGKVFALRTPAGGASLKVTPVGFEVLTGNGLASQAPYFAKGQWVAFDDVSVLDDADLKGWIETAHGLMAAKLTRAQRAELGL